eukprot:s509_g17.t1
MPDGAARGGRLDPDPTRFHRKGREALIAQANANAPVSFGHIQNEGAKALLSRKDGRAEPDIHESRIGTAIRQGNVRGNTGDRTVNHQSRGTMIRDDHPKLTDRCFDETSAQLLITPGNLLNPAGSKLSFKQLIHYIWMVQS